MTPGGRDPRGPAIPGREGDDARVLAWLTAPEQVSARRVLDATFADLPRIRQDRWRAWTPVFDALSRPATIELPRWAWMALVLLLLLTLSIATLSVAGRIRPFLDRLTALPAEPAVLAEVPCPASFAAAGEVRCRMASVPERHREPAGPAVEVLVAEFPVTSGAAADGVPPLVVPMTLDPDRERTVVDLAGLATIVGRTVIGVAPRGTGGSEPSLACPELEGVPTPPDGASLDSLAWREALNAAVRGCRDRLTASGVDLGAYGLAEQAADLESIRKGLGIDRWLVRTIGDESRLALELIRRYPDHVAGALLIRPAFPSAEPDQPPADSLVASISALTSMCAADEFCAGRYRSPGDAYEAATQGPEAELVDRALRTALATSATIAVAPSRLDRIAAGDLAWPAAQLAERGWCLGFQIGCTAATGFSGGGEFTTACLDRAPSTGTSVPDPWDVICEAWAPGEPDDSAARAVASDVPVVVFAAGIDPFHDRAAITSGMGGLTRGVLVPVDWAPEGTGAFCLDADGDAWIDDPGAALPTACTQVAPPVFADAP